MVKVNANTNIETASTTTTAESAVRVRLYDGKNGLKGFASIRYHGMFFTDLEIREKDGQLSVWTPSRRVGEGEDAKYYRHYAFDEATRENVTALVLDAYNNAKDGTPLSVTELPFDETAEPTATVRAVQNNERLLAFATVTYGGCTIYSIAVRPKKSNPDEAYIEFPNKPRMKGGEHVVDESGFWVKDTICGPTSAALRARMEDAIAAAME